jgi:hypothetical protein
MFMKIEVYEDYVHEELKYRSNDQQIQLDIFLPNENLAIEYQGEQHYHNVYAFGPQWRYNLRDEDKRIACQKKGITLIEVPYWWDFKKESLQATLYEHRPDLVLKPNLGVPIPIEPSGSRKGTAFI